LGTVAVQIDLITQAFAGGHGLDHVGRLGLPVIADEAHRQINLGFFSGGVRHHAGRKRRGQS
jgi:hypothetical protein